MDKTILYNNNMITDPINQQKMYEYLYSNGYLIRKDIDTLDIEVFKQWLVGFVDGDGSFGIIMHNTRYVCMFAIRLHIDDKDVLHLISTKLNMPVSVVLKKNESVASLVVRDRLWLKSNIVPIMDKYPLLTPRARGKNQWL
jgi:hypothetical protein